VKNREELWCFHAAQGGEGQGIIPAGGRVVTVVARAAHPSKQAAFAPTRASPARARGAQIRRDHRGPGGPPRRRRARTMDILAVDPPPHFSARARTGVEAARPCCAAA
jgi:hypothetical protein